MEVWAVGFDFERGPPEDNPCNNWLNVTQGASNIYVN
jgi:hypothetical protein